MESMTVVYFSTLGSIHVGGGYEGVQPFAMQVCTDIGILTMFTKYSRSLRGLEVPLNWFLVQMSELQEPLQRIGRANESHPSPVAIRVL